MANDYAESERGALALIACFANRLSARDVELLEDMATHNEWVVAFECLCQIITHGWDRLSPTDLAMLQEVGAPWERPREPVDWEKLRSLVVG